MKHQVAARGRGSLGRMSQLTAAVLFAAVLLAAIAASASASNLLAVIAPIGSTTPSAYTVTIQNNGPTTEGPVLIGFGGEGHAAVSGVVPSTCTFDQPLANAITCPAMTGGQVLQICWVGPQAAGGQVFGGKMETFSLSPYPTIGSCPTPGFVAPKPTPVVAPPTAGGPAGAAGVLTFGKVSDHAKAGTATLKVTVSGAGSVKLSGQGVKAQTVGAKGAGPVSLTVKAKGKSATTLANNGKVTLNVSVTFTPTGGSATTLTKKVKLLKT